MVLSGIVSGRMMTKCLISAYGHPTSSRESFAVPNNSGNMTFCANRYGVTDVEHIACLYSFKEILFPALLVRCKYLPSSVTGSLVGGGWPESHASGRTPLATFHLHRGSRMRGIVQNCSLSIKDPFICRPLHFPPSRLD